MIENIELNAIQNDNSGKSDSEEYHEISQEVIVEGHNMFATKLSVTPTKEYDFFVQYDTQKISKEASKKKKAKKKDKPKKLTDILKSELSAVPLLTDNIITMNYSQEQDRYLTKNSCLSKTLKSGGSRDFEFEKGLNQLKFTKINPTFPQILEGVASKDNFVYSQYVEPSLFSDLVTEYLDRETKENPRFLDVILKDLKFKHHHDFSFERLLCTKLLDYYNDYRLVKKSLDDIKKKVEVNRRTRNSLYEQLTKINGKDDVRFDKNVLKYTKIMLEYKEQYFKELMRQKEIVSLLMTLWDDVKLIREKSGCNRTDYIYEFVCNKLDEKELQIQWSQTFENEYSDLIVKIEYDYLNKYLEYKTTKRNNSEKLQEKNKIVKPTLNVDYDVLKVEVENIVNDILSLNELEIILKRDKAILGNLSVKRKSFLPNKYYCFKVFVDNVFVCESEQYIDDNGYFEFIFTDSLSIEILPQNKTLSIILFENDKDVAVNRINLFDIKKNTDESCFMNHEFTYNETVEPTEKKVGCGFNIKDICEKNKVRIKSSNLFKGKLYTRCEVNVKLGWNEKLNDNQRETIISYMNIGRQLKRLLHKDKPNIDILTEIINDLYENNVEYDINIMKALKDICIGTVRTQDTFNLKEESPEFTRYKLLHLRNKGGLANVENKTIPLFASQISTEQLNCLQKSEEKDYRDIKKDIDMDPIDLQRFIGIKFVEKLNKNLMINLNEFLLKKTFKDVVRDFGDISFRSIFSNQMDLSLSGSSNVAKQQLLKECLAKEQEIQIHVLRAFNLSDRSSTILSEENDDNNIAGFKVHPLRPFVRLSYHGVSAQTATAIGCHPTWNYIVKLKSKFDPLSTIHINIYDECKDNDTDMHSDDTSAQTMHYRKLNKWLGTINVPLHAVLSLGSIRGTFKLTTPPLVFGYENMSSKDHQYLVPDVMRLMKKETSLLVLQITTSLSHLGGHQVYSQPVHSQDDFIIQHLNKFVTDYISDYPTRNISLTFIDSSGRSKCVAEFLQPIPLPDYELPIDPKKVESALSKSSGHSKSSSSKSSRKKSSFMDDKESVSSSFDAWKREGNELTKKIDAAVRYVSLIPSYNVTESYVVTLMGVELLKVLYGSPLDHTILLASYFLYLGIKCWIITGFGLPRGQSSYVLVKYFKNKVLTEHDQVKNRSILNRNDGYTWYIYDAGSGERYELREIGCPLKTVQYVFDCENIWVNIQSSQACESMSFDFSKSSDWQPVFNKPLFVTRPITESLYSKPGDVENLRLNLETKIKNKIQKWRSHVKTIWNRYCSSLLKEMLPQYEYWAFNPTDPRPSPGHRLKQLMATYKIYGFPINTPYINTKLIISNIKSTLIHMNNDPNVEFGLGVDVYVYPNNVISVWIFLACITRI